ncbi:ATP-binding cassette domain-containing protein [Candidatus Parcubacteria bacterium]|nr:ATP-binding cassette domain-containing protein [Candidatus Parcubacteria bacterium]
MTDAIVIKNLTKSFKNQKVLEGINLVVPQGKMLALLGPNGAGKTTTIRILSTLLNADGGQALVGGFDVAREPKRVRSIIGLTGQYAAVDEYLNGRENLEMMGALYHLGKSKIKPRAQELLEQFDLVEAASKPVKTYSGGMRRRLDLALSLISTPPIIFLDEPTTGLDPRSRILMWDIIKKLMEQGVTILLTTQYLEEADKLADRIAVLDKGKIIAEGTPTELKSRVGSERIEITIDHKSDFKKAVSLIQGSGLRQNPEERSIGISTDGSVKEIKRVLDILDGAGIEIDAMSVHTPTLDDVFLHFTGKETNNITQ